MSAKAGKDRLRYMPGLDGLRAVAVLAVFLYHAGLDWMPGGFLGVDVFFVISGFLITSLLLAERERSGRIDLLAFWAGRGRRLLPAVFVLILVCLLVVAIFMPERLGAVRGDALASVAYVTNWHLILGDQSYFAEFTQPSLLKHLWSLAVEEQFYLLWPILFAVALTLLGRRGALIAVAVGALLSALLMAVLFVPAEDPSRIYFGADTRAATLLVGVALAFCWHPMRLKAETGRLAPVALDVAGGLALLVLVATFVFVHDFDPGMYRGGFLGVALASAVLIAVLAHPASRLSRVLAVPPLLWLGLRSYSFYLWHWPVLALTRPNVDVDLDGPLLVIGQFVLVSGLAALSYRYVERPFRSGRRLADVFAPVPRRRAAAAVAATGLLAMVVWAGLIAPAPAPPPGGPDVADVQAQLVAERERDRARERGRPPNPEVLVVGESVMIDVAPMLQRRLRSPVVLDAAIARQPSEIVAQIDARRADPGLPDRVVVQIGNNGPLLEEDQRGLVAALREVPDVVLVNVLVDRSWEEQVNEALPKVAAQLPGATVVDWHGAAEGRGDLTEDGTHLTEEGDRVLAGLIADALGGAGSEQG